MVDSNQGTSSVQKKKLTILHQITQKDASKRELLRCLSDGMWHTTSELARYARKTNPVIGMVTVGTILSSMQQQLGEHFLEQMVQQAEEGVSSWRVGVEWLDVVDQVLKQSK